ncbi:MAG: isochorismate pyruvate lyase [Hyphomicrobiaceae bacterium]|jgi:isochorismate pyruvate lyase
MAPIKPQDCENMDQVRVEIDRLDTALVELLSERHAYVQETVRLKTNPSEATVPWRIEQVIERVRVKADNVGVPADLCEALWREMIAFNIRYEEAKLKDK